jgi:methyl-accepting chemotaxis protein
MGDRGSFSHSVRCTHVRRPVGPGGSIAVVIMAVMADKDGRTGARTGTERIRKLAQAALNADVTVEQVDTILEGLSETLVDLNNSTGNLDATLERFNETINSINELAPRLIAVVDRMEGVVSRVERIVGIGESVMSPWAATEQAVRGAVKAIRDRTHI